MFRVPRLKSLKSLKCGVIMSMVSQLPFSVAGDGCN